MGRNFILFPYLIMNSSHVGEFENGKHDVGVKGEKRKENNVNKEKKERDARSGRESEMGRKLEKEKARRGLIIAWNFMQNINIQFGSGNERVGFHLRCTRMICGG